MGHLLYITKGTINLADSAGVVRPRHCWLTLYLKIHITTPHMKNICMAALLCWATACSATTPIEQLTDRILSSTAGIDSQAFRTGRLNNSDWNDFANATSLLYNVPIYMDDSSGISVPEIKAKIRQINQDPKRDKIGLVIIDYLQLMQSAKRTESRVQEISDITRNLKIMAKELNVPVIALSQLSRAAEKTAGRSDHRPQLSDLRDSGSIEQDADVVLFLYRAAYYNSQNGETEQANENEAECIVAKNRHGETSVVRLGWDGAHTRFSNLDEIHEQY